MSYLALKHLHVMLVIISVALFYTRSISRLNSGKLAANKAVFITSHSIDTLLLISGISVAFYLKMNPLQQPWLAEKLILVAVYIFVGVVLSRQTNIIKKYILLALNTAVLLIIGYLAATKQAVLFTLFIH